MTSLTGGLVPVACGQALVTRAWRLGVRARWRR